MKNINQNYLPSPTVSLQVLIHQTACSTFTFLLMQILETSQIHGLNSNHYFSNKISSVPNFVFRRSSCRHRYKNLRSPLTSRSFTKMPILTKSFFPQCPQPCLLPSIPPLPYSMSLFLICITK